MLKEKIQLAYSDDVYTVNSKAKPFSCVGFFNQHKIFSVGMILLVFSSIILSYSFTGNNNLLVAKQLIANTQAIPANLISTEVGSSKKTVIHVSQYDKNQFGNTIEIIESLLISHKADKAFNLEIVANGQGLKAFDMATSVYAKRISLLANRFDNFEIVACANSLAKLKNAGDAIQLMASIMITPAAAVQIGKRTDEGWLYIKI